MAPAKIAVTTQERNPYALDSLSRSSRSARRAKITYSTREESDEESYEEEEAVEEDVDNDEDDDYLVATSRSRSRSRKRGLPTRNKSLPSSSSAKLSRSKLPKSGAKSLHSMQQAGSMSVPPGKAGATSANGNNNLPLSHRVSPKKKNGTLPTSRIRQSALPLQKGPAAKPSPRNIIFWTVDSSGKKRWKVSTTMIPSS